MFGGTLICTLFPEFSPQAFDKHAESGKEYAENCAQNLPYSYAECKGKFNFMLGCGKIYICFYIIVANLEFFPAYGIQCGNSRINIAEKLGSLKGIVTAHG
mgnify:CR=1 FL=1